MCPGCERVFTFELGHLLDEGIDPVMLPAVREQCPHCGMGVTVLPSDVWELV